MNNSSTSISKTVNVASVSMTVADLEQSIRFYTEVLTFALKEKRTYSGAAARQLFGTKEEVMIQAALLELGGMHIELLQFENSTGHPIPPDSRSNDLWFQHIAIVVKDMNKAYQQIAAHHITHVSTRPQTLPDYLEASGISAFYFRDPDGHNLELIHFPPGKGDDKWHRDSENLFLGIDHTAIAVAATRFSLPFYQEILGFKKVATSENYGTEQEHLNQVFGARLQISNLQADQGIGIELLDYIAPPGGRTYPADSRPQDLWHWHISIEVEDAAAVFEKISEAYKKISRGLVDLHDTHFIGRRGFMLRDGDRHALLIYQK